MRSRRFRKNGLIQCSALKSQVKQNDESVSRFCDEKHLALFVQSQCMSIALDFLGLGLASREDAKW